MNSNQLICKLGQYLVAHVAPKLTNKFSQFKIGMISGGIGQKRILAMAKPILDEVTAADGTIDLVALKKAVMGGFSAVKELPIDELGITIDQSDAEAFFATL